MTRMIDLHAHSTCSDSSVTPTQLVHLAKEKGLCAIALTDHDTVAGLDEAMAEGTRIGVEVVPGIEISSNVDGCDVHIVGLLIDHEHAGLRMKLKELSALRTERNLRMIEKLESAGIDIHLKDMERFAGRQISRGHIAMVLMERGYASSIREAMLKYTEKGTAGYVKREMPSVRECVEMIHEAGGLAFTAHINQIDRHDAQHGISVFRQMVKDGIDGLETKYSEYDAWWENAGEELAKEYHLFRSGGSDFHGAVKPGLMLGTGYGKLCVPETFLDEMKAAR